MDAVNYEHVVNRFLDERCCLAEGATVPVNVLFEAFKIWCFQRNASPRMVQNFASAVVARKGIFFDLQAYKGGFRRVFVGISLDQRLCRAA